MKPPVINNSKSAIKEMPHFFDRYINVVPEENLIMALNSSLDKWMQTDWDKLTRIGDAVYSPGKWTIKEILQHINDNERIQSYRALCFARNDKTTLPGYDENLYVENSKADQRSLNELKEEFYHLRKAAIIMFSGFDNECLQKKGICFSIEISVLSLGFVLAGHQLHHMQVMEDRYFSLDRM